MSTSLTWRTAEELFNAGHALFEENRYEQAIVELRKAEEAFRKLDARGQPFNNTLSNGISGLANSLFLAGRCYQETGDIDHAITCYETSLINEKFEKAKPFRAFYAILRGVLIECYDLEREKIDDQTLQALLTQDVEIDPSFRFPFSLSSRSIVLARLYEFAPERYPHFKDFYVRAQKTDFTIRKKAGKELDESRMKRATISIWMILGLLWTIYSMIVVKALLPK